MKIELKKIKHSESLSEETNAFTADVYINGKHVAYAKNIGHGGSTDITPTERESNLIIEQANNYCKALPPIKMTNFSINQDLELVIDTLLEDYLKNKDEAKNKNRLKKDMLKGILVGTPNKYSVFSWKGFTLTDLLNNPKGRDAIAKVVIKERGNGILNTNIPKHIMDAV